MRNAVSRKLISGLSGLFICSFAAGALAGPSTPAVDLMLSASGFTSLTITGTPSAPPNFNGSFAGYTFSVSTVGTPSLMSYVIQVGTTPTSPHPLSISLTETGLTTNGSYPVFTSYNTAILNSTATVQFQTFYDVTDSPFGESFQASGGSVTGTNATASTGPTTRQEDNTTSPYSLTKVVTLTTVAGASPTIDGQIYIGTPEPMSLALFATGLGLLGVGRRFTRRSGTAS